MPARFSLRRRHLETAAAPSPRRGPYGKTAARRRAILDAALDVFGQRGYRTGSLREVAERVGLSEAGVLHHFTSKVELLTAVLEHRDELARTAQSLGDGPVDGLAALRRLLAVATANTESPGVVELFTVLGAEATDPDHPAHDYFVRRLGWVSDTLTSAFTDLEQRGLLAPRVTAPAAAASTMAAWNGLQLRWLMQGDSVDVPRGLAWHLRLLVTVDPLDEPATPLL